MKGTLAAVAAGLLALPALSAAQQPTPPPTAGPLAAAILQAWDRAARFMPAAADDMPAEKFSFKPSEQQMSFGEIIAHEAQSNETLCSAIASGQGTPSESAAGATAPKEQLVARLRKSFETCRGVVATLSESALGDSVPGFGGRKITKARAAVFLVHDWADHYAQAAMYLRASGILPPSARRRM